MLSLNNSVHVHAKCDVPRLIEVIVIFPMPEQELNWCLYWCSISYVYIINQTLPKIAQSWSNLQSFFPSPAWINYSSNSPTLQLIHLWWNHDQQSADFVRMNDVKMPCIRPMLLHFLPTRQFDINNLNHVTECRNNTVTSVKIIMSRMHHIQTNIITCKPVLHVSHPNQFSCRVRPPKIQISIDRCLYRFSLWIRV